jgi:hypothetical protein
MANVNAPFGFRQYRGGGSVPTFENNVMKIASNNTTKIFDGDAVVPLSTGYIAQATAGTVAIAGIFNGCKYTSVAMKRTVWSNYWPGGDATGDVEAYVINDPNARFVVQAGATAIGLGDINANIQLNVGTGNTATGISGMFVESPGTTATLPFRVVGLVEAPPGANGTDAGSAYNHVIVAFNNLALRNTTGI